MSDGIGQLHTFSCFIVNVFISSNLSSYSYERGCDESPRKVHEKWEYGLSVDFLVIFLEMYQLLGLLACLVIDSEIDTWIVLHSFQ